MVPHDGGDAGEVTARVEGRAEGLAGGGIPSADVGHTVLKTQNTSHQAGVENTAPGLNVRLKTQNTLHQAGVDNTQHHALM